MDGSRGRRLAQFGCLLLVFLALLFGWQSVSKQFKGGNMKKGLERVSGKRR